MKPAFILITAFLGVAAAAPVPNAAEARAESISSSFQNVRRQGKAGSILDPLKPAGLSSLLPISADQIISLGPAK
ncbi:uncharacterized protein BDV14DRAFT_195474 [Aspergillus stella-maris]|uniref:uncharacterized protein n=1 Tax=Aspergillus stella-maris TaxID=1810926 RepID=UPI003CCD8395